MKKTNHRYFGVHRNRQRNEVVKGKPGQLLTFLVQRKLNVVTPLKGTKYEVRIRTLDFVKTGIFHKLVDSISALNLTR